MKWSCLSLFYNLLTRLDHITSKAAAADDDTNGGGSSDDNDKIKTVVGAVKVIDVLVLMVIMVKVMMKGW